MIAGKWMDGAISMGDQLNKIDTELDIWPDAERFCRAFEDIGFGMSMLELDGPYRWVNQAYSDLLGYTKAEILAKSIAA